MLPRSRRRPCPVAAWATWTSDSALPIRRAEQSSHGAGRKAGPVPRRGTGGLSVGAYTPGMPRIDAPTVAEHRRLRHAALLDAARQILLEDGVGALHMRAVAERAGLARNSVYEYFRSRDDLVVAVCADDFAAWSADVETELGGLADPDERVLRYVEVQLEFVAAGRHRIAALVGRAQLGPAAHEQMSHMHERLAAPLVVALEQLGVPEPMLSAVLVSGVLNAATQRIEAGVDPETVSATALRLVRDGLF